MKKGFLSLLVLSLVFAFSGCQKQAAEAPALSASDYVDLFVAAGLPVDNIIVYTTETDTNKLLGRPGEYTSKASFADTRIHQYDEASPQGGTVETFAKKADMEKRKSYIESIYALTPLLGNEYFYVSPDGLALLRISYDLTPDQAEEYNTALRVGKK